MHKGKKIIGAILAGLLGASLIATPALAATHYYVQGYQTVNNKGATATLGVYDPAVFNSDVSIAEVAVKNAAGDTIEVGWYKVAGDVPRLFAAHWTAAGGFQGYNNAAFLDIAGGVNLGDSLAGVVNTNKNFQIYHSGTDWFIGYNSNWIAYLPDSNFSPALTQTTLTLYYGEVGTPGAGPVCTDMGKGVYAAAPATGGVISNAFYYDTSNVLTNSSLTQNASHPAYYTLNTVTARTFTYGGPGAC